MRLKSVGNAAVVTGAGVEVRGLSPGALRGLRCGDVEIGTDIVAGLSDPHESFPDARVVVGSLAAGANVQDVNTCVIDPRNGACPVAVDIELIGRLVCNLIGRYACQTDGPCVVLAV